MGVGGAWQHGRVPPSRRSSARPAASIAPEDEVGDSVAVLVVGPEDFLADRVVTAVLARARAQDPTVERRDVDLAADQALGEVVAALSPNLFGDAAVVVGRGLESADPGVVEELTRAVADGLPDGVRLIVVHPGGTKGRPAADRMRAAGLTVAVCEKPKGRAVEEFVARELARHDRRADPAAVTALRTALGDDPRSLAAAVAQLCSDVPDAPIGPDDVATYYEGVADVPGYLVSDAVWDGRATDVVRRTRWALVNDPGIGPAISAAVASGLRQLGRYGSAPSGMPEAQLAAHVGAPPWKLRQLREQSGRWHAAALARAVGELAVADAAVKGRDARGRVLADSGLEREQGSYQLERTLLRIVSRRG